VLKGTYFMAVIDDVFYLYACVMYVRRYQSSCLSGVRL